MKLVGILLSFGVVFGQQPAGPPPAPKPVNINVGEELLEFTVSHVASWSQMQVIQAEVITPEIEGASYIYSFRLTCGSLTIFELSRSSSHYLYVPRKDSEAGCRVHVERYRRDGYREKAQ